MPLIEMVLKTQPTYTVNARINWNNEKDCEFVENLCREYCEQETARSLYWGHDMSGVN